MEDSPLPDCSDLRNETELRIQSGLTLHFTIWDSSDNPPELVTKIDPQDYDTVIDLDDLLATDDDGIWTEGESVSL